MGEAALTEAQRQDWSQCFADFWNHSLQQRPTPPARPRRREPAVELVASE